MSTHISSASLASSLESELSIVKENLRGVDENLKRLTGRDFTETRIERRIHLSNRDTYNTNRDVNTNWSEEAITRKRGPTGIFARLGAPILDVNRKDNRENKHKMIDFSIEKEDTPRKRHTLSSSVARPVIDGKSRSEAAAELTKDKASHDRNRRMFGALLGTLQRFQNDEAKQKGKDEQRAAIEKKLEDKGKAEKEELRKERIDLFNQRKEQQAKIKRLQYKMWRVKEHEAWETHQKKLRKFIRTVCKPNIFWLPKISTEKSSQLVKKTKLTIEKELEDRRNILKDELERVLVGRKDTGFKEHSDEESEITKTKKVKLDTSTLDETFGELEENCDDILDFEVEEPRQVEEVNPSGKGSNPEMVIVQVASSLNGLGSSSQRRVELVPAARSSTGKDDHNENKSGIAVREIKVVKRERSKERMKVSKSEELNVGNEYKYTKSVGKEKEVEGTKVFEEIDVDREKSTIIELASVSHEKMDSKIFEMDDAPRQTPIEVIPVHSISPIEPVAGSPTKEASILKPIEPEVGVPPANTTLEDKLSSSPVEKKRTLSPIEKKISISSVEKKRSLSPIQKKRSISPVENKRSHSPIQKKRSISPVEKKRSHSPIQKKRSRSPPTKKNESSSSSTSNESDEFNDTSSTSDSESSDSETSDSTSSTSTDSETEKKRNLRKKSIMAARRREEERRKKRGSSNSSSNGDRPRSKRSRNGSPKSKRSGDSPSKRIRRSDDRSSRNKRKRSVSRDRHGGRNGERKEKK